MRNFYAQTNGGYNKTHEAVEDHNRIDSFELPDSGGLMFCGRKTIDAVREFRYDGEWVRLYYPPGGPRMSPEINNRPDGLYETILLSGKRNGYGGRQIFFICPCCGKRVRYLYLKAGFRCRECAKLNYRSSQRTRGEYDAYDRGKKYVHQHLDILWNPDLLDFPYAIPERPRWMHWNVYSKHIKKLEQFQHQFERRQLLGAVSLCKKFGINIPQEYWR